MDMLITLERAANATSAIARGVRPEQFDSPTPCGDWNVEQLMNHLIGSLEYFTARAEGKDADRPQSASPASYEKTVGHLQRVASATAAAWRRPGVLEQAITTTAGGMPGSMLANPARSEMLTRTWDLARATGQPMSADNIDVDGVLAGMQKTLKPEARQPAFGPEVQAPNGAPAIDRLRPRASPLASGRRSPVHAQSQRPH
jgi:uncharacterized protein (TIGR03086 family)